MKIQYGPAIKLLEHNIPVPRRGGNHGIMIGYLYAIQLLQEAEEKEQQEAVRSILPGQMSIDDFLHL